MIKAAFFDVDGTLMSIKTKEIPQSAIDALNKLRQNGIKIFVCTGRSYTMAKFLKDIVEFDGFLTVNGQYCVYHDQVIYDQVFEKETIKKFLGLMDNEGLSAIFVEKDKIVTTKIDELVKEHCEYGNIALPQLVSSEELLSRRIYQIVAHIPPSEDEELKKKVPFADTARSFVLGVDIMPKGGGKHKGVDLVMQHLGLTRDQVIVFGDSQNDISMLDFAGTGVVMGNAVQEVKQHADYITKSVDDDGIEFALEHFKLI